MLYWNKNTINTRHFVAHPKISILLPIRNEAPWLEQRLTSILEQDFDNYELIIGDNASDDGSDIICSSYAENDSRIKIYQHEENIGATNNFNFLFGKATGEYLVVAGGHDLWSKNYIRLLKDKLDSDNKTIIAFGTTSYIDENGKHIPKIRGLYSTEGVSSQVRRFNIYMWADQNPIYGMARKTEALECFPKEKYVVGGQIYLLRMAICGQFSYIPAAIFYRRQNREQEATKERLTRYSNILFDKKINIRSSFWKSVIAIIISAIKGPIPKGNRWRKVRIRFQLVSTSLTAIIRFWPYLW